MSQSIMIYINEDNKLDFFSYFETEQEGYEYIRAEILNLVKDSREFIRSKDKSYSKDINGTVEIILDYKKFIQHDITIHGKNDWHPVLDDSIISFEFKFGDKLYKLFCDHIKLQTTLNMINLKSIIKSTQKIIDITNDNVNITKYHNAKNHYTKQLKLLEEKCRQEYINKSVDIIMLQKIIIEEDKELVKESMELSSSSNVTKDSVVH